MNIYFEVEVFNREFQSRLFLASYSVLENFDVYMMHRNEIIELGLVNKTIHQIDEVISINELNLLKQMYENILIKLDQNL